MYITKNYNDKGGDRTVVGGELEITSDAVVKVGGVLVEFTGNVINAYTKAESDTLLGAKLTATAVVTQADSTASSNALLVADFNALLAKLKAAGIML